MKKQVVPLITELFSRLKRQQPERIVDNDVMLTDSGSVKADNDQIQQQSLPAETQIQADQDQEQDQEQEQEQEQKQSQNQQDVRDIIAELSPVKKDVEELKTDFTTVKSSIAQLTNVVESALVDIRSFQSELVNPINFMRKYIDEDDNITYSDLHRKENKSNSDGNDGCDGNSNANANANGKDVGITEQKQESTINNSSIIKQNSDIGPGRMMEIIAAVEKVYSIAGCNKVDSILEQYFKIGMISEKERPVMYTVIELHRDYNMSFIDMIKMVYHFGKSLRLTKEEDDIQYMKLCMAIGADNKHHTNSGRNES